MTEYEARIEVGHRPGHPRPAGRGHRAGPARPGLRQRVPGPGGQEHPAAGGRRRRGRRPGPGGGDVRPPPGQSRHRGLHHRALPGESPVSTRVGVVLFPGTNCEHDVIWAVNSIGGSAELLWHADPDLRGVDAVVLPGGFAHGDYLRTGAIARFSPVMDAVSAFAAEGGPVVGICNGFQILTEAGLLPGALQKNAGLKFRCQTVEVRVETAASVLTSLCEPGQILRIPINHFEGNFVCDPETLARLRAEDQVVFRYVDNPNGSARRHRRHLQRGGQRGRADAPPRAGLRRGAGLGRRCRPAPLAAHAGAQWSAGRPGR